MHAVIFPRKLSQVSTICGLKASELQMNTLSYFLNPPKFLAPPVSFGKEFCSLTVFYRKNCCLKCFLSLPSAGFVWHPKSLYWNSINLSYVVFLSLNCSWSSRVSDHSLYLFQLHWCIPQYFVFWLLAVRWSVSPVSLHKCLLWCIMNTYLCKLFIVGPPFLKNTSFWLVLAKHAPSNALSVGSTVSTQWFSISCWKCSAQRIAFEKIQSVSAW